jgi:uncharacterized protein YoxC
MGGLWGGFELFSRYQSMEAKIDSYVAPDLSGFDKRLEVIQSEMDMILQEVTLVADVAKELKNDLRGDVRRIETIVEDVEQKVKNDGRELNKDISDAIKDIKQEMADLEAKIEKQIKLALENPLSNMATTK